MAAEEAGGAGWWGGWLQAAKDTSASALEFVKKDLAEFTTTVHHDTNKVAGSIKESLTQENASSATDKVKAGLSSGVSTLWDGLSKALIIEAEDKNTPGVPIHVFSRSKARLHALQLDPATYCDDASGPAEHYQAWLDTFILEDNKGDISEMLVTNSEVRSIYTQLVPNSVSHVDFWQRYFYKVTQLEADEARREALKLRADETSADDLSWDDDWCDVGGPPSPPAELGGPFSPPDDIAGPGHLVASDALASQAKEELESQQHCADAAGNDEDSTDQSAAPISSTSESDKPAEPIIHPDINPADTDDPGDDDPGNNPERATQSEVPENSSTASLPEPAVQDIPGSSAAEDLTQTTLSVSATASNDSDLSSGVVIVNSAGTTPPSDVTKTGLEDWDEDFDLELTEEEMRIVQEQGEEGDFDLELTEEDIQLAQQQASKLIAGGGEKEDWENWD